MRKLTYLLFILGVCFLPVLLQAQPSGGGSYTLTLAKITAVTSGQTVVATKLAGSGLAQAIAIAGGDGSVGQPFISLRGTSDIRGGAIDYQAFGKHNFYDGATVQQLQIDTSGVTVNQMGLGILHASSVGLLTSSSLTSTDVLAGWTGTKDSTHFLAGDGTMQTAGASNLSLSNITAGTLAIPLALGTQNVTQSGNVTWVIPTANSLIATVNGNTMLSIGKIVSTLGDTYIGLGRYAATLSSSDSGFYVGNGVGWLANIGTGTYGFQVNATNELQITATGFNSPSGSIGAPLGNITCGGFLTAGGNITGATITGTSHVAGNLTLSGTSLVSTSNSTWSVPNHDILIAKCGVSNGLYLGAISSTQEDGAFGIGQYAGTGGNGGTFGIIGSPTTFAALLINAPTGDPINLQINAVTIAGVFGGGFNVTGACNTTGLTTTGNLTVTGTGGSGHYLKQSSAGGAVTSGPLALSGYTVATLPVSPSTGQTAYVTDALTPGFGVIVVGGGSTTIPVFYNGANWVAY